MARFSRFSRTFALLERARMITRYMIATIPHVWKDMKVFATTFFAWLTSSGKPMTDRIEVSLSVIIN